MNNFFNSCPYNENDRMSDVILKDYRYLLTLNRFGIHLGFGNQSIGEVCKLQNVDSDSFLLVINTLYDPSFTSAYPSEYIRIPVILAFLKRTHSYFLKYRLPRLHDMLAEIISEADPLHGKLLVEFFEKYEIEVRRHMDFEESEVYPYIEQKYYDDYSGDKDIDYFEGQHNDIEKKLNDLRNIIIKYLPPLKSVDKINDLLYALFQSEEDLNRHTFIEEHILFPTVRYYESKN